MKPDLEWLVRRPIAHRGFHDLNRTRWENTLSAFEAAVNHGFSIECDVQLTADDKAVVFHDYGLKRLTGIDGDVRAKSAVELGRMHIGGTGDCISTLNQVLEAVGGRVPLVIELKGLPGQDERLVDAIALALRDYRGEVAVMSFAHWLVRQFPGKLPGTVYGLTAEGVKTAEIEAHFSMLANGISFVSFNVDELPNPFVSFVRERLSMPVITWTVQDQEDVAMARAYADQMTFEGFVPDPAGELS